MSILDRFTAYFGQIEGPVTASEATALSAFLIEASRHEPSILDKSAAHVSRFLNEARSEKARLEDEIASRQERLRQTVVAIEAFEPVLLKLDGTYSAADDAKRSYDAAIEAKRGRGDRHFRKQAEAA